MTVKPETIAFAVTTFYPKWYKGALRSIKHTDKIRGDLALQSIKKAVKVGYRMVVVDGKSTGTFREELKQIPNIIFQTRKGVKRSPGKRQAFRIASKIPGVLAIVATEAEKYSLFTDCMPDIVKPILEDEADIVIPQREDTLFKKTYPKYMYESEIEANRLYNEVLRTHGFLSTNVSDFDLFFGPRVFRNDRKILSLFLKRYIFSIGNVLFPEEYFDTEQLSNAQFFPVVLALKKKLRIKQVTVPFSYPILQKDNEDVGLRDTFIAKRSAQRMGLLLELMHLINALQGKKRRK